MDCTEAGILRAYLDGELSLARRRAVAAHLAACPACRESLVRLAEQAAEVGDALACLAPGPEEAVSPAAALRAWRARAVRPGIWERFRGGLSAMGNGFFGRRWQVAVAALVAVLVVTAPLTPVGSAVGELLSVFRAEKFAPISIDPAATTPSTAGQLDPLEFGQFAVRTEPTFTKITDVSTAKVDFPVRQVTDLPAGLAAQPEVFSNTPGEVIFTFDLAKAKAALAGMGITAQLPAELDGATVRVYVPAGVEMVYTSTGADEPALILVQGRSPTLELPAALDSPQMRDLFFSLAGLPPELAEQLRAIAESRTTVPVPVAKGDDSREVTVDGVQGLLVTHRPAVAGANAPEGSYVVWQRDGVLYALGGTVAEADLLAAAQSLKP